MKIERQVYVGKSMKGAIAVSTKVKVDTEYFGFVLITKKEAYRLISENEDKCIEVATYGPIAYISQRYRGSV